MLRPEASEAIQKTPAGITSQFDYLRGDPASYYYNKFKRSENKYLDDEMWAEAAKRGESELLAYYLKENEKADNENLVNNIPNQQRLNISEKIDKYRNVLDYDNYIAALANATLDDTDASRQERTIVGSDGNDYSFGQMTDREWNEKILEATFERYDAQLFEEQKANKHWLLKAAEYPFLWAVSTSLRIVEGAGRFIGDIYNVAEGLLNMVINWSGDDDIGSRFLYAFQNDDFLKAGLDDMSKFVQQIELQTSMVNAVKLYDDPKSGGMEAFGRAWASIADSVGYMLPDILLTQGLGSIANKSVSTVAKTAAGYAKIAKGAGRFTANTIKWVGKGFFYTGVFSGNIKETVGSAYNNGISYKQLNAGEVVANASLKAVGQLLIEEALTRFIGASATDKAMYGGADAARRAAKSVGTEVAEAATKTGWAAFGETLKRVGAESLKEGLEESLQDLSDGLTDFFFSLGGSNLEKVYQDGMEDKMNLENLVTAFVLGAATNVVIGSFNSLKYLPKDKRAAYEGADGKVYTMGFFQNLNFQEAMQTMNSWSKGINDPKLKAEERLNCAYRMAAAIQTLTPLFRSFSMEQIGAANYILMKANEDKINTEAMDRLYKNPDFANMLYAAFETKVAQVSKEAKDVVDITPKKNVKEKIIDFFNKVKDKLKRNKTTEITNIVTETTDPNNTTLDPDNVKKLQAFAKEAGVVAIVSGNGNGDTFQIGDVMFTSDQNVENGNVEAMIQGVAFNAVRDAVRKALPTEIKETVLELAKQISKNRKLTLHEALDMLLFDKEFYTNTLLAVDANDEIKTMQILAELDKIVKAKGLSQLKEGTITEKGYKALLSKVQETMQAGLVRYCTEYCKIDIDNISSEIITPEMREKIKTNKNVIATTAVNDIQKATETKGRVDSKLIATYDSLIDSYSNKLTVEEINELKRKIRSSNVNDQVDARCRLELTMIYENDNQGNKTLLLFDKNTKFAAKQEGYIRNIESELGDTINNIYEGKFDINNFGEAAKQMAGRYDLNDKLNRTLFLQEIIFSMSDGSLTISGDGIIGQVLDKNTLIKKEYLDTTKFRNAVKDGKVETVKDLVKVKSQLPKGLLDLKIVYDPNLRNAAKGMYTDGNDYIVLGPKTDIDNFMHELTHAGQYLANAELKKAGKAYITGGSTVLFKNMEYNEAVKLNKWLYKNLPMTYEKIRKLANTNTFADVVYFSLLGEMQARSRVGLPLLEAGFKYREDGSNLKLITPDNKEEFNLRLIVISKNTLLPGMIRPPRVKNVTTDEAKTETRVELKTKEATANDIINYGLNHPVLSKNMPQNDVGKNIINTFNVDPIQARDYVLKLNNIQLSNDFESIYNKIKDIDVSKASKDTKNLYKAGVEYFKQQAEYAKAIDKWFNDAATAMQKDSASSKDMILTDEKIKELYNDKDIKEFMKGASKAVLTKDGNPELIYRGAPSEDDHTKVGMFASTDPSISAEYIRGTGNIKGYIVNAKDNEIIQLSSNEPYHWAKIPLDAIPDYKNLRELVANKSNRYKQVTETLSKYSRAYNNAMKAISSKTSYDNTPYVTTDDISDIVSKNFPEIKVIIFDNIKERKSEHTSARDFIMLDPTVLRQVVVKDEHFDQILRQYYGYFTNPDAPGTFSDKFWKIMDTYYSGEFEKSKELAVYQDTAQNDKLDDFVKDILNDIKSLHPDKEAFNLTKEIITELTPNAQTDLSNITSFDKELNKEELEIGFPLLKALEPRRLTPLESFRLMGIKDVDAHRIMQNQSDRYNYHLAGDSIVVNVLQSIFDKLYNDKIITKDLRLIELFAGYGSQNFALKYSNHKFETWKIAEWAIPSIQAYKDAHHSDDNTDYAANENLTKEALVNKLAELGVSQNYNSPMTKEELRRKSFEYLKTVYNNIKSCHNLVNIQSVNAESLDIKDTEKYDYLMTYSFPCQDLSQAGKRLGMKDINTVNETQQLDMFSDIVNDSIKEEQSTRSGMIWQIDRILKSLYDNKKSMPKILLMENVAQIHNKTNLPDFKKWIEHLSSYGYTNSYFDLVASDFGIPQKRIRTFMVSILNGPVFEAPKGSKTSIKMTDLLESSVDSKYNLTDSQIKRAMSHNNTFLTNVNHNPINSSIAATLTTSQSCRLEGGNMISSKASQNLDLVKLLHPKTEFEIKNAKRILSKLQSGQKLKSEDLIGNYSMFDEDTYITSEDYEIYTKGSQANRVIKVSKAKGTKLENWTRRGKRLLNERVQDFVIAVSPSENFNKLPNILKNKIDDTTLNLQDVLNYVKTANNINDYTFQTIARTVFHNEQLANITFKDMTKIAENIQQLAILGYLDLDSTEMTPTEMFDTYKNLLSETEDNKELKSKWLKAVNYTTTVKGSNNKYHEVDVDPKLLNGLFFRYYDGTVNSLRTINNIGKTISNNLLPIEVSSDKLEAISEKVQSGDAAAESKSWNWIDKAKRAEIDYESTELSEVSRTEKEEVIANYISNTIIDKLNKLPLEQRKTQAASAMQTLNAQIAKLETLSDEAIDKRYIIALGNEVTGNNKIEAVTAPDNEMTPAQKTTSLKNSIRNAAKDINARIAGLKSRWNKVSDSLADYFDITVKANNKTQYTLNDKYKTMNDKELTELKDELLKAKAVLKNLASEKLIEKRAKEKASQLIMEQEHKMKYAIKEAVAKIVAQQEPKTIKEKVDAPLNKKIKIVGKDFVIKAPREITELGHNILNTYWSKQTKSNVQKIGYNNEQNVHNAKDFFRQNTNNIMSVDLSEIEDTLIWFLEAKVDGMTDNEMIDFLALKMYLFGYILDESEPNKIYANINPNLRIQIRQWLERTSSGSGTLLSVWNNIRKTLNPIDVMASSELILDGVIIDDDTKNAFFDAIKTGDIQLISKAEKMLLDQVEKKRTNKKSILRNIMAYRSMAMLSSPMTWLRNRVSNFAVDKLNKLSSKIGNKIFSKKTVKGQLKIDERIKVKFTKDGAVKIEGANITPEIQKFVNEELMDTGIFDKLVDGISKYNIAETKSRSDIAGQLTEPSKEEVMTTLVLKSMYNQYYNEHMFEGNKALQKAYKFLMKAMSDDPYVRRATIKYFAQIVSSKNSDLSKGMTDSLMNDFAISLGLALRDYMHSDNIVMTLEKTLRNKSEAAYYVYKLLMPYAGAAWNWFKGMLNYSPLGLIRAIYRFTRLEKTVLDNEQKWSEGKSDIPPNMTEHFVRRDLGAGVLGTIGYILGMILTALGLIRLDDDDHGTPKLRIGNITVDVSSIFGTSSILSGAALIKGLQQGNIWTALGNAVDYTLDSFPLMDIIHLDMFSNSMLDVMLDQFETIALSFIPNFLSYLSGATYTGTIDKSSFWARLGSKLPFVGNFLPKKVDPYTGSKGSIIDTINRIVPYFSWEAANANESKTNELGLNKSQLRGNYTINGESFNIKGKDLQAINEMYGKWNAQDLTKFYDNKMSIKVKTSNGYARLTYNQMNAAQRKNAVQAIMSNNAELAKIYAWTTAGNKYYATNDMYTKLHKYGVTKNVYRGSKGFVKK